MGVDINVYRAAIGTFSNASRNISVASFNQFQRKKHEQSVKLKTHSMIRWLNILVLLWVGLSVELNGHNFRDACQNKISVTLACQPWGEKICDRRSLYIVDTFYRGDHQVKTFYTIGQIVNHI